MKIKQITESSTYDPSEDRLSQRSFDDTRKPKLTLRHLNKIRKVREFRKIDMKDRKDLWKTMYNSGTNEVPPTF